MVKFSDEEKKALRSRFRDDLISGQTAAQILSKYDRRETNCVRSFISGYFDRIIRVSSHIYVNLNSKNVTNFGLLGDNFKNFVLESKLFKAKTIRKYSAYFGQYGDSGYSLDKLIQIFDNIENANFLNNAQKLSNQIDFKIAGYEQVDSNKLYREIILIADVNQQLDHLVKNVRLSQLGAEKLYALKNFLQSHLRDDLELSKLAPKLIPFGGLVNGLGMYDSDIDMLVKFKALPSSFLQNENLRIKLLKAIETVLRQKIRDFQRNSIDPTKKVPLVMIDFEQMPGIANKLNSSDLRFNSVDMNVNGVDGLYNSLWYKFLAEHDHRFKELILFLKYFCKQSKFISDVFSSYGFTAKVIFFLQNTNPLILPSFNKLQSLSSEPIWVNGHNYAFTSDHSRIAKSTNKSSTPKLIVDFFKYYKNFDYDRYMINVQTGKKKLKTNCNQPMVCYDPFSDGDNITGKVTAQMLARWKKVVGIVADKITEQNCVQLLSNPINFDLFSK